MSDLFCPTISILKVTLLLNFGKHFVIDVQVTVHRDKFL